MRDLLIRAGRPDELGIVEALLRGASEWLASRGIDQWQYPPHRDRITAALRDGVCFLVFENGEPVATLQVDDFADPEFWTPDDEPERALYVHRMAVSRRAAGGMGATILDWAGGHAAAQGKQWLRLDAWKDNEGLHRYYKAVGFTLVRIVDPVCHRRYAPTDQRVRTFGSCGA